LEGNMVYNNVEFYLQDNWRVNNRLTLDYGMRFTHQGPFYDQLGQMSNFFIDEWNLNNAPLLYVPGCRNNMTTCSGNDRMAMNPATGELLDDPSVTNTAFAIGTMVPG